MSIKDGKPEYDWQEEYMKVLESGVTMDDLFEDGDSVFVINKEEQEDERLQSWRPSI